MINAFHPIRFITVKCLRIRHFDCPFDNTDFMVSVLTVNRLNHTRCMAVVTQTDR